MANRLTPYVYPPAPGESDQDRELKQGLDDNVIAEMELKFGYDYDFIIFYSDFVFDTSCSPTGDLEEDQRRFDQITVSPGNMCCVCCSKQGESRINKNFKENVTWISYEEWEKDINIEMSHPLVKNKKMNPALNEDGIFVCSQYCSTYASRFCIRICLAN